MKRNNPSDQRGASLEFNFWHNADSLRRLVRDTPSSGSNATLPIINYFLPGFPVIMQKIVVRRSGSHNLLSYSKVDPLGDVPKRYSKCWRESITEFWGIAIVPVPKYRLNGVVIALRSIPTFDCLLYSLLKSCEKSLE